MDDEPLNDLQRKRLKPILVLARPSVHEIADWRIEEPTKLIKLHLLLGELETTEEWVAEFPEAIRNDLEQLILDRRLELGEYESVKEKAISVAGYSATREAIASRFAHHENSLSEFQTYVDEVRNAPWFSTVRINGLNESFQLYRAFYKTSAEHKHWDDCIAVFEKVPFRNTRSLLFLVDYLVDAKRIDDAAVQLQRVEEIVDERYGSHWAVVKKWLQLSSTFSGAGRHEAHSMVEHAIELHAKIYPDDQTRWNDDIAEALVRNGALDRAVEMTRDLDPISVSAMGCSSRLATRSHPLAKVAMSFAKSGKHKEAIAIAEHITSLRVRATSLTDLVTQMVGNASNKEIHDCVKKAMTAADKLHEQSKKLTKGIGADGSTLLNEFDEGDLDFPWSFTNPDSTNDDALLVELLKASLVHGLCEIDKIEDAQKVLNELTRRPAIARAAGWLIYSFACQRDSKPLQSLLPRVSALKEYSLTTKIIKSLIINDMIEEAILFGKQIDAGRSFFKQATLAFFEVGKCKEAIKFHKTLDPKWHHDFADFVEFPFRDSGSDEDYRFFISEHCKAHQTENPDQPVPRLPQIIRVGMARGMRNEMVALAKAHDHSNSNHFWIDYSYNSEQLNAAIRDEFPITMPATKPVFQTRAWQSVAVRFAEFGDIDRAVEIARERLKERDLAETLLKIAELVVSKKKPE